MKENMTFEEAIENNEIKSMAVSIVDKYRVWVNRYDIFEDLYNICFLAVWQGLENYDDSKGTKLSTYLYGCMWRKVSNYIINTYKGYKGDKAKFNLSYDYLDEKVSNPNVKGEEITLGSTVPVHDKDVALRVDLLKALEKLSSRERDILISKTLLLTPHKELQDRYNIKRSTVDSILQRTKKKLRKELEIKA